MILSVFSQFEPEFPASEVPEEKRACHPEILSCHPELVEGPHLLCNMPCMPLQEKTVTVLACSLSV